MLDDQILNARMGLGVNRDALDEALQRLAAVEIPSSRAERRELAALWKAAAEAVHESDGTTGLLLDLLRTASNLDPEDERLAAEVAYQAERRRIVAARLESAARERAARRDSETLN